MVPALHARLGRELLQIAYPTATSGSGRSRTKRLVRATTTTSGWWERQGPVLRPRVGRERPSCPTDMRSTMVRTGFGLDRYRCPRDRPDPGQGGARTSPGRGRAGSAPPIARTLHARRSAAARFAAHPLRHPGHEAEPSRSSRSATGATTPCSRSWGRDRLERARPATSSGGHTPDHDSWARSGCGSGCRGPIRSLAGARQTRGQREYSRTSRTRAAG